MVAIDQADLAESTKNQYRKAVLSYLETGASLTDPEALATYAANLPKSSRAFLKAAVGKWAEHMETAMKGQATPENVDHVTAAVYRFESLQEAIKVKASKGEKAHTWLNQAQVKTLLELPDRGTLRGRRDRIALGLLVAAGLRRAEAVALTFTDISMVPMGDKFRSVLNVTGKGAKDRAVPINDRLAADLDAWAAELGGEGRVIRSISRAGKLGESLTAVSLFRLVNKYGKRLGHEELAPHDLRRTYAQLGYEAGVPITQISTLLGHASVATTQRYLNLELDVNSTISDFIPY
jgi:integrase